MIINVATLLQEAPGGARHLEVAGERAEVASEHYRREVEGEVRLLRTTRGILVRARLEVEPEYECSRCLKAFTTPVELVIEELFAFKRDPVTHAVVEVAAEEFQLEDEQYLDLSEAIRQYEESARPIKPLCRPDCAGLCPNCGSDWNDGPCACTASDSDPAWSALNELASRLRATEVSDGRS